MQQVWRKRWRNTGWIALGAITLVLLVSAINKKNHKVCSGVEVSFNRDGNNFFVDEKGVIAVLKAYGPVKGEAIENIDLKALEQRLKSDMWIASAELFFDNKQVLQVIVEEKEPVARIFTVEGNSFYIDSACKRLPLSEKLSARIPMFTNFPSQRTTLSRPDSQLLASAKELAMFIQADDFWKAQVAQVDITPTGFEMIPTIGSHIVALGKDGNWQQKFDRLFSFYKQVWTQVGFEKYEKIDVQFDGQVVATIKGAKPARVDSVKARMAYENLLAEVKNSDTVTTNVEKSIPKDTTKVNTLAVVKQSVEKYNHAKKRTVAGRSKGMTENKKSVAVKQVAANKKVEVKKVPKAIMKKSIANKSAETRNKPNIRRVAKKMLGKKLKKDK
jgi:cell division protein FtsQ